MAFAKAVAVVPGPRTSFLDHLIPLCELLAIPLHCSDPWVETCATLFYPKVEIVTGDLAGYSTLLSVEPSPYFQTQRVKRITGFHGNPGKFRATFWIERYADEDVILIYGDQLIDYFKEKGVWERLKKTVRIGNLRYAYYKHHQAFFDAVAKPHLFPDKKRRTILWAPTWSYTRTLDDSPFFSLYPTVLGQIPEEYQMVVKLHPYMFRLHPEKIEALKAEYPDVHFIDELPLVYPFLNQADIFIGDYSSVVYDFLAFDKPLFFLGNMEDSKRLFQQIQRPDTLSDQRKKAYAYAFGEEVPFEEIRKALS